MKKFPLDILFMTIAIVALCANTVRQHYALTTMTREFGQNNHAMTLLQVQLMDRLLEVNRGKNVELLLSDPDAWLDPLLKSINSDQRKILLLKQVAFRATDEFGVECFRIYCNPVNSEIDPYELFTFYFQGEQCVEIKRDSLLPW